MKLIWKVAEAPTGRFRSFDKRGWPSATYETKDGSCCSVNQLCR